jgi:hypothetical protein
MSIEHRRRSESDTSHLITARRARRAAQPAPVTGHVHRKVASERMALTSNGSETAREQLVEFERRVQVAHGQLLVGGAADQLAHDTPGDRVAPRRPEDRAVDRLHFLDRRVGLELAHHLLCVRAAADERDVRAQARVANPLLRDRLHDPGVRRAVEDDDLDGQPKPLLDPALDPRLELLGVALAALEEDVPARDVGRDVAEAKTLHARLQIRHLDE